VISARSALRRSLDAGAILQPTGGSGSSRPQRDACPDSADTAPNAAPHYSPIPYALAPISPPLEIGLASEALMFGRRGPVTDRSGVMPDTFDPTSMIDVRAVEGDHSDRAVA
jgi:hypothetical protein